MGCLNKNYYLLGGINMVHRPARLLALGTLLASIVATPALATNGYFLIGYGAKSRSMGGVGVAYGQDGLAAAANPAAMADVDVSTMRVDAGGELFIPKRGFVNDSATLESGFPGATKALITRAIQTNSLSPAWGVFINSIAN